MFGMLDYRAHKLLWLVFLPVRIVQRQIMYATAIVAGLIAQKYLSYPPFFKWLTGYGGFQLFWLFGQWILFFPFDYSIKRLFFWIIDVVPAHGADENEARAIVEA